MLPISRVVNQSTNRAMSLSNGENGVSIDNVNEEGVFGYESTLSKCPRSLYILW